MRGIALTEETKQAFLAALRKKGCVVKAARAARVTRQCLYSHKTSDPDFRQQWAESEEIGHGVLLAAMEREADRRGQEGTLKPVYQGGALVGHIREYSDTLLIFRMKALDPKRYRENKSLEVTGKDGRPIEFMEFFGPQGAAEGAGEDTDGSGVDP